MEWRHGVERKTGIVKVAFPVEAKIVRVGTSWLLMLLLLAARSQRNGPAAESNDCDFCAADAKHAYWSETVVTEQEPWRGVRREHRDPYSSVSLPAVHHSALTHSRSRYSHSCYWFSVELRLRGVVCNSQFQYYYYFLVLNKINLFPYKVNIIMEIECWSRGNYCIGCIIITHSSDYVSYHTDS